jgi:hypothetical protein
MGLQEAKIESLPFVIAELNYLGPAADKPWPDQAEHCTPLYG